MNKSEVSDLIFDAGAHKGEDSDFYLKLGYRVVAIEANPILAEALKKRFSKEIGDGRYTIVDKAIGDTEGTVTFFVYNQMTVWGTADLSWAKRNKGMGPQPKEIKVQSVRFSDLVREFGCPYYLKIDIEGADMLCVNALKDVGRRPQYISIESTKTSWSDLLHEFNTLEKLGYIKFMVVAQGAHKNGMFRNRNRQLMSHSFEREATGPFGENLDGAWLTKKQAIRKYVRIFALYKTLGDNTLLRKLLKRIPILRRALHMVRWYDTHAVLG